MGHLVQKYIISYLFVRCHLSLRSKTVFFVYTDILREIRKTEMMKITTYETIMVMLAILTLIMSIICIVIKLLLYIIENNAKK